MNRKKRARKALRENSRRRMPVRLPSCQECRHRWKGMSNGDVCPNCRTVVQIDPGSTLGRRNREVLFGSYEPSSYTGSSR